jgi:cytochrome P450 family 135
MPVEKLPKRVPLPMIVQTLWSLMAMDSFVQFCFRRFPDERMLTCRILGFGNVVSVFDPDLIREIFTGHREVLGGGEINARALGFLGPSSIMLLDGVPHLRSRRLLLPPFHGDAIPHHARLIKQITLGEIERWPVGEPFALWPRMHSITLEVIMRAVIGVRDDGRRQRLTKLLQTLARGGLFARIAETRLPWLTRGAIGRRLWWGQARTQTEQLLYEEIADHRADPEGRDDILAMLIAARDESGHPLSDDELYDHVLTLLAAGHDTTAAALAWCFERVLRHPDVLARCREASENDEYLTAVVNETLRVRPVVVSAPRKLQAPLELGGYHLPTGTVVAASIAAVHHSPAIYPDPLRFSPERFLERPVPYTFIPFGGGERRCIGAGFAMMEIRTVLQTVLQRIDLCPADPHDERPSTLRSIGVVPARGARVIATSRAT